MKNSEQIVKGEFIEVRCRECGQAIEVKISIGRTNVNLQIAEFERAHKHPKREK